MKGWLIIALGVSSLCASVAFAVPAEIEQPGTQPDDAVSLQAVSNCTSCHANYDEAVEPWHNWQGSMMSHAGRDPIFWATMAISEQDFEGSGDLCLRCHTFKGWVEGRSSPSDGSALTSADADGVECGVCHRLANTDDSEHVGVQTVPYIANDGESPATGYYGGSMASFLSGGVAGPYSGTASPPPHGGTLQSDFHRSAELCGTCHDVSNPATGDLAHNNGAQVGADPVIASGDPEDYDVRNKAAFNNFPYQYGVVERTYSEFKAGALGATQVSAYSSLPADLQDGAIKAARDAAVAANPVGNGNYLDGTARYFSCQTCHMQPVSGKGASSGSAPTRDDLPSHDLTGGNYWMGEAIQYLDDLPGSKLFLGSGLNTTQKNAMDAGALRAKNQLELAASLLVTDDNLKVTNLTGHKLISGYPEGRRMWLEISWYDYLDNLLYVNGEYGPLVDDAGNQVTVEHPVLETPVQVRSLLDLHDEGTRVYETHYGMTQEWADQLIDLEYPASMVLMYDRYHGEPASTLGELQSQAPGTAAETFHFVLNNTVVMDTRIPPYGMDAEEARKRNILPVPSDQYGGGAGGVYNYWDDFDMSPPANAARADIKLRYQPTSWEYVQFLYLANDGSVDGLENEGDHMLEAWLETGMAEPHDMTSTTWSEDSPKTHCDGDGVNADLSHWIFVTAATCETSNSIDADELLIRSNGDVELISGVVSFGPGLRVETGGQLTVMAGSP